MPHQLPATATLPNTTTTAVPVPPCMAVSSTTAQPAKGQRANSSTNSGAASLKKRRRVANTGATEDCFACKQRRLGCDRRRPYCGQCVEKKETCAGYHTTLTWGMGIASRGKMRGMSLPMEKLDPPRLRQASDAPSRVPPVLPTSTAAMTNGRQVRSNSDGERSMDLDMHTPASSTSSGMRAELQECHYLGIGSAAPLPVPSPPMAFTMPEHGEYAEYQRPQTGLCLRPENDWFAAPCALLSMDSSSDTLRPCEPPRPLANDFPFTDSLLLAYSTVSPYDQAAMASPSNDYIEKTSRSAHISCGGIPSVSPDHAIHEYVAINSVSRNQGSATSLDIAVAEAMGTELQGVQPGLCFLSSEGTSSYGSGLLALDVLSLTHLIPSSLTFTSHLSPRMLYLLDYYDRFICPILVAFDGPTNPYRAHIINLAMRNEELQNAIGALATNNMRMRGGIQGRRLSVPHDTRLIPDHAYSQVTTQEMREMHGEASDEERRYKATSVALLNKRLASHDAPQDDSVLATLLILCLFHVCDSGFANFKTHLAGVRKLLSLRDTNARSDFVGWIDTFFTWFDVMTAAVNDREVEVSGESLDMMNLGTNLGALEHYSGCEGRLFKLIARLGGLSLLSQSVRVQTDDDTQTLSSQPEREKDLCPPSGTTLVGDEWAQIVYECQISFSSACDDASSGFWSEWIDTRIRLQEWTFPSPDELRTSTYEATSSPVVSSAQTALLHISESFRYAALLYTERLAYPTVSAGAFSFQNLVSQGLYHISQIGITSCVNKFLLWPLFIIGTECVYAEHRAVVRQRCIEIQRESGFFNNLSSLEILERVWHGEDDRLKSDIQSPRHNRPVATMQNRPRRSRAVYRVDGEVNGEYIII